MERVYKPFPAELQSSVDSAISELEKATKLVMGNLASRDYSNVNENLESLTWRVNNCRKLVREMKFHDLTVNAGLKPPTEAEDAPSLIIE